MGMVLVNDLSLEESTGRISVKGNNLSIKSPGMLHSEELFEETELFNLRNLEIYKALPLSKKIDVTERCNMFEIIVELKKL